MNGLAAWSVDSRDYREHDPVQIAARVVGGARAGGVILLHDGPENAATAAALGLLLGGLKAHGLAVVRLR